jgi:ABC-type Fe3+ transport system permease subunit
MVLFAFVFEGMGLAFAAIFEWTLREGRTIHAVPPESRRLARRRFSVGALVYAVAIAVAFASPMASFVIIGLVAVYYVFERTPAAESLAEQP